MDDEVIIISVDTGEAVKNVGELKTNIQRYKEALETLDIGSEKYANTLNALQINQAALKSAMHATTAEGEDQGKTMEQIAKDAMGLGTSYNSLVRQMAQLDQQFRATEDDAERMALGKQIKDINDQLKKFDEDRGKFGRNVGNYKSALDGMAGAFKATAGSAGAAIQPLGNFKNGLTAISKTPVIAILGLLVNVISAVAKGLKSSETNTMAMKEALSVFQPIINATTKAVQKLGEWLVKVVEWAGKAARWLGLVKGDAADAMAELTRRENELLKDQRAMKVEEAKINAEIAELQRKAADKAHETAKAREKYAQEAQQKEDALFEKKYELAQREFDLLKQRAELTGNSTAENEKLAEAEARLYQLQAERSNRQRNIQRQENQAHNEVQRSADAAAKAAEKEEKERIASSRRMIAAFVEEANTDVELQQLREMGYAQRATMDQAYTDSLSAQIDERMKKKQEELEEEKRALAEQKRLKEERTALAIDFAAGVADLAGSIAEIYEANGEADEKSAKKAKALRVAESIINTISGAVAAFTGTIKSVPGPVGIALAAVNSAAVLAAGYANVRKIQQQKVGSGGGDGGASIPAIATAPATPASIQQVRTITGATEEQRLNAMAGDQRVYLVYSDVEAAARSQRVKVQETSW
jgi:chromosome segregation ATPase